MKKVLRIILPIFLTLAVVASLIWYLFVYDREFTRDTLLSIARHNESIGNHAVATWFYNIAYSQSGNDDSVAIELANQYKASGNYTKAEYTLSNAIKDGGGIDLYIALCKTYVEQDKLLDAVNMLDGVTNPEIKAQLDSIRPSAPAAAPTPGFYNQYISVTLSTEDNTVFASVGDYPSKNDIPYSQPLPLSDGENKVYALSIAQNGLVSPLSISGYTIGGVVKEMEFHDSVIEKEIRQLLNVTDAKQLYTNDLWAIKNFTVPANATDLSDLTHMAFLETLTIDLKKTANLDFLTSLTTITELNVNNASVSSETLRSIAALPQLKKLSLTNCYITNIEPLSSATALSSLNLSNNTIRDLTPLSSLQSLQELYLAHNAIVDITTLATLPALNKLDISYNSLSTIAPIAKCTTLTWLNASVNAISNLGTINELSDLNYLNLESNKLTSVSAISGCSALEELNIASNSISDIKSLSVLKKLAYFNFSHNSVKELPSFSKDAALITIDGSHNSISKLDKLRGLKNLNIVNMDYNKSISSVAPLEECPRLVKVNVYGTKVKKVSGLLDLGVVVNYKPV